MRGQRLERVAVLGWIVMDRVGDVSALGSRRSPPPRRPTSLPAHQDDGLAQLIRKLVERRECRCDDLGVHTGLVKRGDATRRYDTARWRRVSTLASGLISPRHSRCSTTSCRSTRMAARSRPSRLETAAATYEVSLAHEPTLETILSLATLYWESMNQGVTGHLALPHEFELLTGTRIEPLASSGHLGAAYLGDRAGKGRRLHPSMQSVAVEESNVLAPACRSSCARARSSAGRITPAARAHPISGNRYVISMLSSRFPSVVN